MGKLYFGPVLLSGVVLLLSPSVGGREASSSCLKLLVQLESKADSFALQSLKQRYASIPKTSRTKYDRSADAQRLINASDWQRARKNLGGEADLVYSQRTLNAWNNARQFTLQHSGDSLTPELLGKLHGVAMKDLPFHGYEGRRLLKRYKSGEIDHATFKKMLSDVYKRDANPSSTDHSSLAGLYRQDPLDDIRHAGTSIREGVGRYFTEAELRAVRKNPLMRIDESSVRKIGPGEYEATAYFTPPAKVQSEVSRVFNNLNKDLQKARDDDDVIRAVAKMELELIVIHPFLDGNGRTIRLFRDMIFDRYGLPPAALIREEEITTSLDDYVRDLKQGMRLYVDGKAPVGGGH